MMSGFITLMRPFRFVKQIKQQNLPVKAIFNLQRGRSTSNRDAEIIKIKVRTDHNGIPYIYKRSNVLFDILS